MILSKSKT